MKSLANAAKEMPRSGIRVILDLAANIQDVIHLEIGQPNFPTPEHICTAAFRATQQGFTGYTPNAGLLSLREAVAEKVCKENGIGSTTIENIVITTGGMGGIFSSFAALLEPGDELLIPDPGYPNYEMGAYFCRAAVIRYPLDTANGFLPRLDALPNLVTPRTKAIVINSPANPSGSVIPLDMMRELVSFTKEYDLYIISDECYEKIIFEAQHVSPASMDVDGRVLSVFSFSKTYSMTGWRVGFVVSSKEISPIISKMQEAMVACASSVSQKAAEAALKGPQDCVPMMVNAYRRRRDRALGVLKKYGLTSYIPQGAFYLLVDIYGCDIGSYDFAKELLLMEKVAVAPGRTFGLLGDPYVRISLATDDELLEAGLEKLCTFILKKRRN